jgi:hypothetical protein
MFGDFQYTTMRKEMPLQNALFLLIPVSYVAGWTLASNVNSWTDIVQVAAGVDHTVGMKSNGTVVAVGRCNHGQCDVNSWTDIVQVAAGVYHTVGVKSNGTVVAVGRNSYGECDVSSWTDIVQVAAGSNNTVGMKNDGTVVAVGWNDSGKCDVSSWTDIVKVAAGRNDTVGVKSDGTVVAVGRNAHSHWDVSSWTDIVMVAAGSSHAVGVKSDGTVVADGNNSYGQCDVGDWNLIVTSNQPPSAPQLLSPSDGETNIDPNNVVLSWNPSSDPDGDDIEYCIYIEEVETQNDIYVSCEGDGIIAEPSLNLADVILDAPIEPGKTYRWSVYAVDEFENESEASEWWNFTPSFTLDYLTDLYDFSWANAAQAAHEESMFSIIWNCKNDFSYTYSSHDKVWIDSRINAFLRLWADEESPNILDYMEIYDFIDWTSGQFITPWLDAIWYNEIRDSNDNHFNTVHKGIPNPDKPFEVISYVDELSPICGTSNINSYFFTYDSKYDTVEQNDSELVTFGAWINYLQSIVSEYSRSIDVLTIFAHGEPAEVKMSEAFHLRNDQYTQGWMESLKWNENTQSGILSKDATILIFSCRVAQSDEGKEFVKNLANWTGATVYANTEYGGGLRTVDNRVISDWDLDVIGIPDNYILLDEYKRLCSVRY